MDPAEGSAKATLVVTCSFLSPAGLPTLDANDPESESKPTPHLTFPRPLLS